MKVLRMVVGIICCVLFAVIMLQSCAVGLGNTFDGSGETSGSVGFLLGIFMLVGGIIGIAGRKSMGATITATVFFLIASIFGISSKGSSFSDLEIYGYLNLIFAGLFIISLILERKKKTEVVEVKE